MKKIFKRIFMIILVFLIVIVSSIKIVRDNLNYTELVSAFLPDFDLKYLDYIKENYQDEYNYYSSYLDKYLKNNDSFKIDRDKLLNDVYIIVDDLNEKYNLNIDKEIIENEVDKIILKIKDIKVYQKNSDYLKFFRLIFNNYFYYFIILLTFITILIIIVLSDLTEILKNFGVTLVWSGVILILVRGIIRNIYYILSLLTLFNKFFIYGLYIVLTGILLMFINYLIIINQK